VPKIIELVLGYLFYVTQTSLRACQWLYFFSAGNASSKPIDLGGLSSDISHSIVFLEIIRIVRGFGFSLDSQF